MPIYEYQCGACGHSLESFEKVSDKPLKDCPNCSKQELQKLVSAAGFKLKGTGWYVTDFKDKKQPESKKSSSNSDSKKTGGSAESKSTSNDKADK